jgi:hypothetical protein
MCASGTPHEPRITERIVPHLGKLCHVLNHENDFKPGDFAVFSIAFAPCLHGLDVCRVARLSSAGFRGNISRINSKHIAPQT